MSACRPTVAEVDLDALARNLTRVRRSAGGLAVWAVVKADGYGHGAVPVARRLVHEGVEGLCVATASEGMQLREAGIEAPVLVLGPLTAGGAADPFRGVALGRLATAVPDAATATALAAAGEEAGAPVRCHLKVDTGMSRLGCSLDDALPLARQIAADPHLLLDGVMSNLGSAEEAVLGTPGAEHARRQIERFERLVAALLAQSLAPPHRTLANSAALLNWPPARSGPACTGVRPGLALYGGMPGFEPVMRLRTRVASVRAIPAGARLGYGTGTVASRDSRIALLPLGYHDGLPRALGNRGEVSLRGRRAHIVGAVSMDLTLVDVTEVPGAAAGDEVVLFGDAAEGGLRVEQVAAAAGTIPWEILCRIGPRVPRLYRGGGSDAGAQCSSTS